MLFVRVTMFARLTTKQNVMKKAKYLIFDRLRKKVFWTFWELTCSFKSILLSDLGLNSFESCFIRFCSVVSLEKMVTLTTNIVYKKFAQYRKYIWYLIPLPPKYVIQVHYHSGLQRNLCNFRSLIACIKVIESV